MGMNQTKNREKVSELNGFWIIEMLLILLARAYCSTDLDTNNFIKEEFVENKLPNLRVQKLVSLHFLIISLILWSWSCIFKQNDHISKLLIKTRSVLITSGNNYLIFWCCMNSIRKKYLQIYFINKIVAKLKFVTDVLISY